MKIDWMLENSDGKKDAMLTMAAAGFAMILLKLLLSGAAIGSVSFGELDAGIVAALLTPTLGSYVARRYTDQKLDPEVIDAQAKLAAARPSSPEEREDA